MHAPQPGRQEVFGGPVIETGNPVPKSVLIMSRDGIKGVRRVE
jgi:hypothetical protein